MNAIIVLCGNLLDGISETMSGPMEILVQGKRITSVGRSVERPPSAQVIDFSDRTVSPRFIDTHVHLTMDAANLARQTLDSSASKALKGLSLARLYMSYGFTTLRDLDSADPDWPTIDLRDAINAGIVQGPRIFVAAHIISASAGHGDLRSFYNPRWTLPVSTTADDPASVRALVRREHSYGSDWIKTTNTGGYYSAGDDLARVTWFDDEMEALTSTAHQLGMPVAVHTGAPATGNKPSAPASLRLRLQSESSNRVQRTADRAGSRRRLKAGDEGSTLRGMGCILALNAVSNFAPRKQQ